MVTALGSAVAGVRSKDQRFAKKDLLNLRLHHAMLFVLSGISRVPLKADNPGKVHLLVYGRYIHMV